MTGATYLRDRVCSVLLSIWHTDTSFRKKLHGPFVHVGMVGMGPQFWAPSLALAPQLLPRRLDPAPVCNCTCEVWVANGCSGLAEVASAIVSLFAEASPGMLPLLHSLVLVFRILHTEARSARPSFHLGRRHLRGVVA